MSAQLPICKFAGFTRLFSLFLPRSGSSDSHGSPARSLSRPYGATTPVASLSISCLNLRNLAHCHFTYFYMKTFGVLLRSMLCARDAARARHNRNRRQEGKFNSVLAGVGEGDLNPREDE